MFYKPRAEVTQQGYSKLKLIFSYRAGVKTGHAFTEQNMFHRDALIKCLNVKYGKWSVFV